MVYIGNLIIMECEDFNNNILNKMDIYLEKIVFCTIKHSWVYLERKSSLFCISQSKSISEMILIHYKFISF